MSSRRGGAARGQSLVEFALVAPLTLLCLLAILDMGRGIFYYTEMAAAAREGVRQAALEYNQFSNTVEPSGCASPCQVHGVLPQMRAVAGVGYPIVYADSASTSSLPWYGAGFTPSGSSDLPGTVTLSSAARPDTLYVFIYQLNQQTGAVLWPCACASPVRTGGNQLVVVDVKMRFQPAVTSLAGAVAGVTLDAQSVQRLEWQ